MGDDDFMGLLFPEVFVKKIEIKEIMPCTVEVDRIKFLAQVDRLLDEVLLVLYLVIPKANFSQKIGALSYKNQQRIITIFGSGRITMTYVKDRQEAEKLVEELRTLINHAHVYLRIHGKPEATLAETKKTLSAIKLYERLPRTNCKECGEQSCFVFATKLFNDEKQLRDCLPLTTTQKAETRREIEKMLAPIKL